MILIIYYMRVPFLYWRIGLCVGSNDYTSEYELVNRYVMGPAI